MEYTKSSISRITLVVLGILLGITIVSGVLLSRSTEPQKPKPVNRVFPTATPIPSISPSLP